MPIIINEFEIIPAAPAKSPDAETAAAQKEPENKLMLRPEDIERVDRRRQQRRERIRAD
jgi:hypothetical protein